MKIAEDLYQVGGASLSDGSDAAIYLVRGRTGSALIDAGTGDGHARVMKNIQEAGVRPGDIAYIFLTHCHYDHTGGAHLLRSAPAPSN